MLGSFGRWDTEHEVCFVDESQIQLPATEQKEFFYGPKMGQKVGVLHHQQPQLLQINGQSTKTIDQSIFTFTSKNATFTSKNTFPNVC